VRIGLITTDVREHIRDYGNPTATFGAAPEALLHGFSHLPGVEIHVLSCARQPMQSQVKIADNIWFHGLHVPKIGWMRTAYQGCVRAVRNKLKQIQPDIVHGQGTEMDCGVDAVLSGFPNVITIHGNMVDIAQVLKARPGSFHWCAARLENFVLKRTRGVFCNSRYTEQVVGPRARRTWAVPNPLRVPFLTTPRQARRNERCVLLHVGVVCKNKCQLEMLAAARSLFSRHPNFELRFIGSADRTDPYVQSFLKQIEEASRLGYAHYVGTQSLAQLIQSFDEASALVHTPVAEAFGLVVAEALARDVKVFGFRVGGIADIVEGVADAVLVESGDWSALESALESWLAAGHPSPRPSAPLMLQRYQPATIARRHVEIYRDVLNEASSRR